MKILCRIDHKQQDKTIKDLNQKIIQASDPMHVKQALIDKNNQVIKELCWERDGLKIHLKEKDCTIASLKERIEIQDGIIKELRKDLWWSRDN